MLIRLEVTEKMVMGSIQSASGNNQENRFEIRRANESISVRHNGRAVFETNNFVLVSKRLEL